MVWRGFEATHIHSFTSITNSQISSTKIHISQLSNMSEIAQYKRDFLSASIKYEILKFGSFTLKSGRTSSYQSRIPLTFHSLIHTSSYFFNAGRFDSASSIRAVATAFASTILEANIEFDILFGPAYKGIPLATATAYALGQLAPETHAEISYSFDRKEAKTHGEGGNIVGAPLKGKRCLIVDDVVTAGTAKREAIEKIRAEGGIVAGVIVALDRQEKLGDAEGPGPSAIGEIKKEYGIPVLAVITLDEIIEGLKGKIAEEDIKAMETYRARYKASD